MWALTNIHAGFGAYSVPITDAAACDAIASLQIRYCAVELSA
jgi:hypothetical protein